MIFWLKKTLAALILPPLGPLLFTVAGLLLLGRCRRLGKFLAWSGVALTALLSTPISVSALVHPLEAIRVPSSREIASARAIVILGGGKRDNAPEFGGPTVSRLTLERVRYGARLQRESGLPVLVSGGVVVEGPAEAQLMRETLERDFATPVRWTESASRNTEENAQFAAAILRREGIDRVVLVTHAVHMPRAQAEFARAGIGTIAAPTGFLARREGTALNALDFAPNANAAHSGWLAVHEWIGDLARRVGL